MPFPYVEPTRLELELPYEAHDFGIEAEGAWRTVLSDALKAATEDIEGWTDDGVEWRDPDADVPYLIRGQVIRLARLKIAGINEDGLSSETTAAQASLSYRPPSDVEAEIKSKLDEAGYRTDEGDDFVLTA